MTGNALVEDHAEPVCGTRRRCGAAALPPAPTGTGRELELSLKQVIACQLRGSLNALILSLHVLERHGAEPQALEFASHVAQAAKRINTLATRLYVPEATGLEAPAPPVRPSRL